ncbi:CBS protein [Candidatus Zixiibacteriota bacterium]|nr:CBS protein [candidate division Zixibacteria bacterium]
MKVADILNVKGREVITIESHKSVKQAMERLTQRHVGALPVLKDNRLVGIISERDILRLIHQKGDTAFDMNIGDIMTTNLIVGVLSDDLDRVEALMTNNRFRHLPIMEGPDLAGIISIGDVVKAHVKNLKIENLYLIDYITGKYPG